MPAMPAGLLPCLLTRDRHQRIALEHTALGGLLLVGGAGLMTRLIQPTKRGRFLWVDGTRRRGLGDDVVLIGRVAGDGGTSRRCRTLVSIGFARLNKIAGWARGGPAVAARS